MIGSFFAGKGPGKTMIQYVKSSPWLRFGFNLIYANIFMVM